MRATTASAVTITITVTLTAAALLLLAAPAVAGGGGGSACRTMSSGGTLTMLDSCFDGIVHEVEQGTTLEVVNAGELPHTVTAVDGSFDSGNLDPGESFEVDLADAGQVPVYCTLHGTEDGQGMAGILQVTGEATAAPIAAETPTGTPAREGVAVLAGLVVGVVAHRAWSRRSEVSVGP